ncbi:uncharacterized mitochondrial protein AtMg00810-like [Solanum lycopersicum]|uniref:uncharacterized mitochondrial protein AtMg00810-like n=1 Tax=Solanum lycopersicum TaxID=4081 RepID=UPI00374949C7
MEVSRTGSGLFLHQSKYAHDLLQKTGLEKCTSQPTLMAVSSSTDGAETPFADITHFRSLIGALQYLVITRPDIQFAVNRVAQRMHQPSENDYHCLKRILRYIFGTLGRGLLIRPGDLKLWGFSDSDWANDKMTENLHRAACSWTGDGIVESVQLKILENELANTTQRNLFISEYLSISEISLLNSKEAISEAE